MGAWYYHRVVEMKGSIVFAVDNASSVLRRAKAPRAYMPFGFMATECPQTAFTGQRLETGQYLMGAGYRAYSPDINRFGAPDRHSPFGRGGLNSYAYCGAEPVNRADVQGANWTKLLGKVAQKSIKVESRINLELRYVNKGLRRTLRFDTTQVEDATQMYKTLGTLLSERSDAFRVMTLNAERVKSGSKTFERIPDYAPLRDPTLFEKAIELQHRSVWGNEPIRPLAGRELPRLTTLDPADKDVRHTLLSYLFYQDLADRSVVARRGRIDPWAQR